MRFCAVTLGCKANQYDTGEIESGLNRYGIERVLPGDGCDVCIINTCAVTAESVRKSHQMIRRIKNKEPDALIAVCGCCPQLEPETLAALGADIIGSPADKGAFINEIISVLHKAEDGRPKRKPEQMQHKKPAPAYRPRTRALLKIQDGCDNRCAYCLIPYIRGAAVSVPLQEIAAGAAKLASQGYKEIVITGIEISSYKYGLIEALAAVSRSAPNARLRLGSLHPGILTDDFITRLGATENICNHFHISLQSGCDAVLQRMNRHYTTGHVSTALSRLRAAFDNCGITADLIAGFPGETDAEFATTLSFIKEAGFSAMHIFPYSTRPGTAAAAMPEQTEKSVKMQRAKMATEMAEEIGQLFLRNQTGRVLDVIFETSKSGISTGRSGNYLTVAVSGSVAKNTRADVRVLRAESGTLYGEMV